MSDIRRKGILSLFQLCFDRPILLGLERIDLALPITDQTHGHGLHAPCGQPFAYLAPEQRRELVADDAVEHTARLLGIHLFHVDRARVLHSLLNRGLCDLMEDDAAVFLRINAENECQMPRNRLPLAVGVACEIDFVCVLCLFFERTNEIALTANIDVLR